MGSFNQALAERKMFATGCETLAPVSLSVGQLFAVKDDDVVSGRSSRSVVR
jgi:hypothetical protein